MNDENRRALESGQRCRQWIVDNASLIPAGSIFDTKTTALTTLVGEIETNAGAIEAAVGEGLSATDVKGSERLDLIDIMGKVRNAARAAESENPGTRDRYRFNAAMSHEALLAAGRSFAAGGPTDGTLLTDWGAPAGWPADVTTACDEYEAAFGQQDSAVGSRIAANADINAQLEELLKLKSTIGHLVKNYAASKPGAQAAWKSAAHIERGPKTKTPTPPTP